MTTRDPRDFTPEGNSAAELERLLDQVSDSDFGEAKYAEHLDSQQQPLVLRDWTGQDFANIYVQFYPHVLRHAKRYLTNHSQAEEVTQDAFLYLMTSLPEVDSEVGVLKLLKWKVRLIALDVIGANSKTQLAPIEEFELAADDRDLSHELERADDAAIVALALAKLEPRQREALIASLYEEKATREVAEQLQLNENATKQLIFRAKTSFRRALVGEAETRGLSVSQILLVAAKKARQESGKYVSAASALLLVIAVSVGILPNLAPATTGTLAVPAPAASTPTDLTPEQPIQDASVDAQAVQPIESFQDQSIGETSEAVSSQTNSTDSGLIVVPAVQVSPKNNAGEQVAEPRSNLQLSNSEVDLSPFDPWLLDGVLEQGEITTELLSGAPIIAPSSRELLTVVGQEEAIWADLEFAHQSRQPFQRVNLGLQVDGAQYFALASQTDLLVLGASEQSETYVFVGEIGAITDVNGAVYDQTRLSGGKLRVTVTVNPKTNQVAATTLELTGR